MPYPFKKSEDLVEWLIKLWQMMGETVSDAPSAFVEQKLTDLEIEHKVRVFDGTEDY